MNKEKLIELLDKFMDRSERYIDDAKSRKDEDDQLYYQGQEKVVKEIKDIVSKW